MKQKISFRWATGMNCTVAYKRRENNKLALVSFHRDTVDDYKTVKVKMFFKLQILLALAVGVYSAEISNSYASLEKATAFDPNLKTERIDTHPVFKKATKLEEHPVYRPEERARIEPVKPVGAIVRHDKMLSDQPSAPATEVNRVDNLVVPGYAYLQPPSEVAYPDVPYAPGYGYDSSYAPSNNNDMYNSGLSNYMLEPEPSLYGLLWSQVPDGRTIVSAVGRTIGWVFRSVFVLFVGALLTIGVCTYTNICTIHFPSMGPIHEEMRSLVTPERLEKISNAADFVKNAIDKYQKIQMVNDSVGTMKKRRSIFY